MTSQTIQTSPAGKHTFFGHPRGLATLFMTEMWERFSFYGMRAILALYLAAPAATGGLGLSQGTASAIVGVYLGMVYFTSLPGGWIADRIIGARRAVLVGGIVIMGGHISLAVPGAPFTYLGLVLICCGTGLLKPNISTMVGGLYTSGDDSHRDAGFSIFLMGINIGAFLAPLVAGTLGQNVNWHLGFGCAAVGMALGLTQYIVGGRALGSAGAHPANPATPAQRTEFLVMVAAGLGVLALAGVALALFGYFNTDGITLLLAGFAALATVGYFSYMLLGDHGLTRNEKAKVKAFVWLFICAALFWLIYDQAATVLSFFAQKQTNLNVLGFHMPSSWTQSFNPVMIIVLAPVFSALWVGPLRRLTIPAKFAIGLILVGVSFVVMSAVAGLASGGVKVTVLWLVLVYLIQTCGELCLTPTGLSATVKLAPQRFVGQMMGLWWLSITVGDSVGGQMAKLEGTVWSAPLYFTILGSMAVLAGLAMVMFVRRLCELMADRPEDVPVAA